MTGTKRWNQHKLVPDRVRLRAHQRVALCLDLHGPDVPFDDYLPSEASAVPNCIARLNLVIANQLAALHHWRAACDRRSATIRELRARIAQLEGPCSTEK